VPDDAIIGDAAVEQRQRPPDSELLDRQSAERRARRSLAAQAAARAGGALSLMAVLLVSPALGQATPIDVFGDNPDRGGTSIGP
jgi:hypothetical protein